MMRNVILLLVLFGSAWAVADIASTQNTLHVPSQYKTVQAAIQAARDHDTVLVAPGRYVETIDFLGKTLAVRSRDGARVTTLDGNGQGSVVTFQGTEPKETLLQGFTITGGTGTARGSSRYGGGIHVGDGAAPFIRDNVIAKNTALSSAGQGHGGGVYCGQLAAPFLLDNVIQENEASTTGGGVACIAGQPILQRNRITDNRAGLSGGGLALLFVSTTVEENEILRNTVPSGGVSMGGGVYQQQGSMHIRNNRIEANSADQGGGVLLHTGTSTFTGNTVSANTGELGGGLCVIDGTHHITGNVFMKNQAVGNGHGGGVALTGGSGNQVVNNVFFENHAATRGGGLYSRSNIPLLVHDTVVANTSSLGGGLFFSDLPYGHTPITNTILWANRATSSGPQIEFTHSQPQATHCLVEGGWAGPSNLNVPPLFADQARGDLHLMPFSPGVDGGDAASTNLPPLDFEGDPRNHFHAPDIGADEVHPHLYVQGTPAPGHTLELKVFGTPGNDLLLGVGAGYLSQGINLGGLGTLHLLPPIGLLWLGRVPATGLRVFPVPLPAALPVPCDVPLQVLNGPVLSNPVVVKVR